jgi:phosphatidic acid-selective phospholipase A1
MIPVVIPSGDATQELTGVEAQADKEDNIRFFLFTPNSPDPESGEELLVDDVESLARSSFIAGAPLKTLAHGFSSGIRTGYPWNVREAYLAWQQPMNLILVDWSKLAMPPLYNLAAGNTKMVGEKSARLLAFLLAQGVVSISDIHIQGISLGAHVAGVTGSTLTALTGLKAPRISAYDPAMPLFANADDADRIDPSDAEFVDVTHTAGGTLGMVQSRGHVDFYPNGGRVQPGCALDLTGTCSHFRASALNIESIGLEGNRFVACRCDDWAQFDKDNCPCTDTALMGEHVSKSATPGSYFLRTAKSSPFALG